jgi:hypothetical protein
MRLAKRNIVPLPNPNDRLSAALGVPGRPRVGADQGSTRHRRPVHQPDPDLAVFVLPQNVRLAAPEVGVPAQRWEEAADRREQNNLTRRVGKLSIEIDDNAGGLIVNYAAARAVGRIGVAEMPGRVGGEICETRFRTPGLDARSSSGQTGTENPNAAS